MATLTGGDAVARNRSSRLPVASSSNPPPQCSTPRPTPTPTSVDIVEIPQHILRTGHQQIWGNKVVLAFEEELLACQVKDWIIAYNQEASIQLSYHDELPNALFVVKIESSEEASDKATLLRGCPLKAREVFATVNDYYRGFCASNPVNFTYLVTAYIKHGDPEFFRHLQYMVKPIGILIRGTIASGVENHRIIALVSTKLRKLPPDSKICLLEAGVTTIPFDYIGRNLRCTHCFSYKHFATKCTSGPTSSAQHTGPPPPQSILGRPPPLVAPPTRPQRIDTEVFNRYQTECFSREDRIRRETAEWRARAEEQQQLEEEALNFDAQRAVDFEEERRIHQATEATTQIQTPTVSRQSQTPTPSQCLPRNRRRRRTRMVPRRPDPALGITPQAPSDPIPMIPIATRSSNPQATQLGRSRRRIGFRSPTPRRICCFRSA
ncbi:unnamed protein product [Calypogeia fissa]